MNSTTIDNYTKGILTAILLCLCFLVFERLDLIPKAYAGDYNPHPGFSSTNFALVPLDVDGSITVKFMAGDELDVNIVGISTSDDLDVNIDGIGGGYVSYGGPISVEIE